jgi:ribosomal RNA-processing protein 12
VRTGALTHSAAAFRPGKKGTGGDASRAGGVQPYAYWPMDAKLLNRRAGRRRDAARGLDKVVSAVRAARKGKAKQRGGAGGM